MIGQDMDQVPPYLVLKLSQALFQKTPASLAPQERQRVDRVACRQLQIEQKILATPEAAQIHLPVSSVNQAVAEIRERYASREEFLADLESAGLDDASLRLAIERDLRFEAVLERVASLESPVSDTDVEIFYLTHRQRFLRPENRTLSHLLVTINENLPGSDRLSAWRKISALHATLTTKPSAFSDLALTHSECPTAVQGGFLGVLQRGQLYPELEASAFKLRLGELSEIIESPMGFHILRCEAIAGETLKPFAAVREEIRKHLTEQRKKAAQKRWIADLFNRTVAD